MNDIITLEQKRFELQDTVMLNRGAALFKSIIADTLKKDFVEQKMIALRAKSAYQSAEAAYYAKNGTVGEF